MEEIFKNLLEKNFEDYKISNYGRLMTPKGKFVKSMMKNGCLCFDVSKRKTIYGRQVRTARLKVNVAQLVYRYFSNDIPANNNNFHIMYRDGNHLNCKIDNLKIAIHEPTAEQIEIYNKNVYIIIKSRIKRRGYIYYRKKGFDIDNLIQESCFLIYKYLSNYDPKFSFYNFCCKYIDMAFKNEYQYFKNNCFVDEPFYME